jgi:hypothetical protein
LVLNPVVERVEHLRRGGRENEKSARTFGIVNNLNVLQWRIHIQYPSNDAKGNWRSRIARDSAQHDRSGASSHLKLTPSAEDAEVAVTF